MNEIILCIFALGDKIEAYCETLSRRADSLALDLVRPVLQLTDELMALNDKKRLACNLYVMYRRLCCAADEQDVRLVRDIALGKSLEEAAEELHISRMAVYRRVNKLMFVFRGTLYGLRLSAEKMREYRRLPLFELTLKKVCRRARGGKGAQQKELPPAEAGINRPIGAAYAAF